MDEKEYLGKTEGLYWQQVAHYRIGMMHLSQGDRENAMKHFRQACAEFLPGNSACYWSEAFLKRMQDDSNWPARIQSPDPKGA